MTPNPYPVVNVASPPASGFVTHCAICGRVQHLCACGATVAPALPPPTRFRLRYGVLECVECGLAKEFCKGHAPADPPTGDGADSDLARRIRAARGGAS